MTMILVRDSSGRPLKTLKNTVSILCGKGELVVNCDEKNSLENSIRVQFERICTFAVFESFEPFRFKESGT